MLLFDSPATVPVEPLRSPDFFCEAVRMTERVMHSLPEWVRWVAQDRNGAWWGFEHEPNEGAYSWYENEVGRYCELKREAPNPAWRETLERVLG